MRVLGVRIPGKFKRFGSLEIQALGVDVELVVMLGPNGTGKSSVFDAFLEWAREARKAYKEIATSPMTISILRQVPLAGQRSSCTTTMHLEPSEPLGPLVHVRTAHRNTPDVLAEFHPKAGRLSSSPSSSTVWSRQTLL